MVRFSPTRSTCRPGFTEPALISRKADGKDATVEVIGIDRKTLSALEKQPGMTRERWMSCLAVRVLPALPSVTASDTPPLLGSYRVEGDVLRFVPRFPLEPGLRYRAELDPSRLLEIAERTAKGRILGLPRSAAHRGSRPNSRLPGDLPPRPPRSPRSTPRARLPENLLRFYIYFSAPMSRGEAYRHIRLLDAAGKPVDTPFLELDEELWSRDGMRFTLLFDPGRIKRGLKPREELGPVLEAGKSYQLVVDRDWLDAEGNPLKTEFRKTLRPARRTRPRRIPGTGTFGRRGRDSGICWRSASPSRWTGHSWIACSRCRMRRERSSRAESPWVAKKPSGSSRRRPHGDRATIAWSSAPSSRTWPEIVSPSPSRWTWSTRSPGALRAKRSPDHSGSGTAAEFGWTTDQ